MSQQNAIDSLQRIINKNKRDTTEVNALIYLSYNINSSTADKYLKDALALSNELGYKRGQADCNLILGSIRGTNDLGESIQHGVTALSNYEDIKDEVGIASAHALLQWLFRDLGDYRNALDHAFACSSLSAKKNLKGKYFVPNRSMVASMQAEIAQTYVSMNKLDSANDFAEKAIDSKVTFYGSEWNFPIYLLATIQRKQGNYQSALANYRRALPLAVKNRFFHDTLQIFGGMAILFQDIGKLDSSIYYAEIVERSTDPGRQMETHLSAINTLKQTYKIKGIKDRALKYTELSYALRDSLLGVEKNKEIQSFSFKERMKEQEFITAQEKYKSKIQLYIFIGGLIILLFIAGLLWRNYLQQKKAKNKIESAYRELKTTQQQLIQSEKMASLGELTAGIAHEIQNPLNFVNNFSDVNTELADELQEEADKGNLDEVKAIAKDIKENEQKINHHGKRADAIVKGMLQHSRTSSGKKELTDINALADEYLRLSYHGLRAKDKSFSANFKTDFDNNVGKINIIPQDIGRVILNLINNAFYAVNEKQKQNIHGYQPAVTVSTKKINNKVEIKVADNGNGIPQKVLDKVFQPFFTTKPTGQGTGLGLSLSYDIVKAHGGEIKVETKDREGSEFIIQLPIN